MCATCFGLNLGHLQACQYQNHTREDTLRSMGPLLTVTIFIMLKQNIQYKSIRLTYLKKNMYIKTYLDRSSCVVIRGHIEIFL